MAFTIRLADPSRAGLRPVLSPLAELSAALHVLASPDHHPGRTDWRTRVLDRFTTGLVREMRALEFLWDGYRANFFLSLVRGLPDERTLDIELEALANLPVARFLTEALQPLATDPGQTVAPGTRPGADTNQLLTHARARDQTVERTTRHLLHDPEIVRDRLVEFLEGCRAAFFAQDWPGLQPTLHQAVGDARAVLDGRGPMALLLELDPGIRRVDATTATIDKSSDADLDLADDTVMLLLPSLLCHPHLVVQPDPAWPLAIQYAVSRRPPRRLPPLDVSAARLAALAEPTRLELTALLAKEPRATRELAGLTGLTEPTVSRHLTVLREAGLVSVRQQGHFRVHHLDLDAIAELGPALRASLLR